MTDVSRPSGSDRPDTPSLEVLQEELGPEFEVRRKLGEGSMAAVYLAVETGLDRPVADKVLRQSSAGNEVARKRFEREARASAALSHPKIVQVYRYGRLRDRTPYLVMRFVKGRTMADRLEAEGRLDLKTAHRTLLEVASALAEAHAHGFIHRDVRPENILWDEEREESLLSDFGIAAIQAPTGEQAGRLTETGVMVGNPRYLSPEQLRDDPLTEVADIYAFGVTGYELVSGRGPFEATTNAEWIRAHLQEEARPLRELRPEVDAALADLLQRCLNKDPRLRPRATDVVRRLRAMGRADARGASVSETSDAPPDLQELLRRRVPQIVLVAVGVGWGLMTLMDQLVDREILADVFYQLTLPFVVAGILASTVVAWFHGERGKQSPTVLEWGLLGTILVIWLSVSAWIVATP